MPYNGSGVFQLVTGNPVVTGTTISSTVHNNTMADIANNGLTLAVTKDGQQTPTANLPMGGFRHTNVGNAVARNDYAAAGQVQDNVMQWLTSVSGTDTITAALGAPPLTAYVVGQTFRFISAGANTGTSVTLNINSIGAKPVTRPGGAALAAGDIQSGVVVSVTYDGTNFQFSSQYGGQLSGIVGTSRNAAITVPSATTTVTYTADELIVESALGGLRYCLANVSQTLNIATTGAGGMASGTSPINGFVAVYVQYNPTSNTRTIVGVDASNAPVAEIFAFPGYSASALVGFLPTNGSGQVLAGTNIVGRSVSRNAGTILSINSDQSVATVLSFASSAPRNAKRVKLLLTFTNSAVPISQTLDVASDTNFSGQQSFSTTVSLSGNGNNSVGSVDVVNTPNIYYRATRLSPTGTPTYQIYLTGFEF